MPKFRTAYDQEQNDYYDALTAIDFTGDPGMTQQAPAEEQDINVIMDRFGIKDGSVIPHWPNPAAMYGDFSDVPNDPVEAAEYIRRGEVEFMKLPAKIRQNFRSGAELYTWLQDDANNDEAIRLGLLVPEMPRNVSSSTSSDKEPLVPTDSKGEPK